MSTIYVVRAGDTLTRIARDHGFVDWRAIYYHPENAAFRARRPDPNRIFPGDQLRIPAGAGNGPPQPGPPDCDFSPADQRRVSLPVRSRLLAAPTQPTETEHAVMMKAFQESRRTVRVALAALTNLQGRVVASLPGPIWPPLSREEQRVFTAVIRWLKVSPLNTFEVSATLVRATTLLSQSLNVRTSRGEDPPLRRNPGLQPHAQADGWLDTDKGVSCGDRFFTMDGPNCQRDVLTHEWFHLVGVNHGGGRTAIGAVVTVPRDSVTRPAQALDSADHMAQLVAEVATGRFDTCARAGD